MSDTYNYNSGSPVGGMGGFFGGNCGGFGGCNNWMDLIALIVVGGLFGFGGFGGFGGGLGARGGQLGADAYAATTAAMISQQNTGERVAGISTGINEILGQTGGIIGQVQRTSDRVQDGFSNLNTYLCQAFNNSAMQGVNNYNGLTGQLTDIRFDAQKCCCETQNMIQNKFCELGYKQQADNPANPYEEPGRYDQRPNASMGFDPYQNQQLPHHEYGRPNREYQREDHEFDKRMDGYFRRLSEGRTDIPESLCEVVASGVHMYMGNSGTGSHGDTHMQYKKAIERIREANSMQEKEKLMKEYFGDDLTEDERVVLRDMSTMKSYKQKAREKWGNNAGMERWLEAKKSLKHKLKNIA